MGAVKTTCPYCGVGCGVLASVDDAGVVTVAGDPDHPANFGRLCSKGSALGETAYLEERLLYPEIMGEQVSWDQAVDTVAGRFSEIIAESGPDSVAFYVSGQLLTEDYYVANKLMKGFIGSGNIDTNSRLCMSSAVAAHKRAFGEDAVPCSYEDLDLADLVIFVGSNAAWCHPILFQRVARAKQARPMMKVINIDPRHTQTSSIADLHLALKPGTDSILFNGLLAWLDANGAHDRDYTANFTQGAEDALASARESAPDIPSVAEQCELEIAEVERFYRLFGGTEKVISVFSQGVNQSSSGVDKGNALINCHLLTGRISKPGAGPFSFTGQPNAMGGREVGGLANQLAAHMDIGNPEHRRRVQRFWQSPVITEREGLKAVDLFKAVADSRIRAVWIIATNPVVSLPESGRVAEALKQCELVVVSDCVRRTDTSEYAHILLPAQAWGEKDGTVTNTERRISRQRPFLASAGLAKPDWWIFARVAQAMGFNEHFDYPNAAAIFREHAALSGLENMGERQFNIAPLAALEETEYDAMKPVKWPVAADARQGKDRLFEDGKFSTDNGKARFIAVTPRPPVSHTTKEYPFVLNTGRVRDHWHTLSRTGMSPRLSTHTIEPYVEIHPDEANAQRLVDGAIAKVTSPFNGAALLRVRHSSQQRRGSLFVPMHWNNQFSSAGKISGLVKSVTDPISGQPESKHSIADIRPMDYQWYGFILSRQHARLKFMYADYWVRARSDGAWRYELAGDEQPKNWSQRVRQLLGAEAEDADWIEYQDPAHNHYRAALFIDGRLEGCVVIEPEPGLLPREWILSLYQKDSLEKQERAWLLSGRAPTPGEDTGRTVCSCFKVGENTIRKLIAEKGITDVEEIGKHLQAGTNCGSCVPELRELIEETLSAQAATA